MRTNRWKVTWRTAARPNAAQRAQLQLLQSAAAQAAEIIKAACPSEAPSTPPARLEAVGYRVHAMLQAVQTVDPPLRNFYASLFAATQIHQSLGSGFFRNNVLVEASEAAICNVPPVRWATVPPSRTGETSPASIVASKTSSTSYR